MSLLYKHFLSEQAATRMIDVLAGVCRCNGKIVHYNVPATRMSGDMSTSLGNTFMNLVLCHVIHHHATGTYDGFRGVCEGDDALFCVPPGDWENLNMEPYGFVLKVEQYDDLHTAGFCQLKWSPTTLSRCRDPLLVMAKSCVSINCPLSASDKLIAEYARAKAFSIIAETPRCPILNALANSILNLLGPGYARFNVDAWHAEKYAKRDPNFSAPNGVYRTFVERFDDTVDETLRPIIESEYGVTIEQQMLIEERLLSGQEVDLRDYPIPPSWSHYHLNFSF